MIRIGDSHRLPRRSNVTYWLLAINLLSYIVTSFLMATQLHVFQVGGIIPAEFLNPETVPEVLQQARPPAVITVFWSMFLHGGFFHLLSNGIILWIFGPNVEAKLGALPFTFFYFACGSVGALCQILYDAESLVPIIGASGAISGLFGAYFAFFPENFIRVSIGPKFRNYRDFMVPVKVLLVLWIITQVANSLTVSQNLARVAYLTHLGGFVCGLLLAGGRGGYAGPRPRFKVFDGGRSG